MRMRGRRRRVSLRPPSPQALARRPRRRPERRGGGGADARGGPVRTVSLPARGGRCDAEFTGKTRDGSALGRYDLLRRPLDAQGPVAPRSVRLPRAPGSSALSSSARPRLPALPDLVDLAVAVARQSVQVDPQCFVELLDLLVGAGFGERVPVENLALGHLGLVGPSHLGDARLLLVGQRTLCGAGVSILLTQALHRKLERRLGGLVGHDGGQCSIQSNARRSAGPRGPLPMNALSLPSPPFGTFVTRGISSDGPPVYEGDPPETRSLVAEGRIEPPTRGL